MRLVLRLAGVVALVLGFVADAWLIVMMIGQLTR